MKHLVFLASLVLSIVSTQAAIGSDAAEDTRPALTVHENVATVTQQGKVLFKLPLTPPKPVQSRTASGGQSAAQRRDHAFLVGHCLLVQRGAEPGELYDVVDQGEIYDIFTSKKSVYSGDEARYWGGRTLVSPSAKWAIMMQEEEGMLLGYYALAPDCSLSRHRFEKTLFGETPCGPPGPVETEQSIQFSYRQHDGSACYSVVIHPDGHHDFKEED